MTLTSYRLPLSIAWAVPLAGRGDYTPSAGLHFLPCEIGLNLGLCRIATSENAGSLLGGNQQRRSEMGPCLRNAKGRLSALS